MRTKIKLFCGLIAVAFTGSVMAQEWRTDLNEQIKWISVGQTGMILTSTNNGMYGVDPVTHEVAWTNPSIINVNEEGLEYLNTAPLAILKTTTGKTWLVNTHTGKLLFDSEAYGFKSINQRYLSLENGILIVDGNDSKDRKLIAVDYEKDENVKWELTAGKRKSLLGSGTYIPTPLESNDYIFYPADENLIKINKNDGAVVWNKSFDKNISLLFEYSGNFYVVEGKSTDAFQKVNQDPNEMGMTSSSSFGKFNIHCINGTDGRAIWESKSFKGSFAGIRIMKDCALVFNDGGTTDRINLENGQALWQKPPRTRTSLIQAVETTDKGFVINSSLDQSYSIEYIDFGGSFLARNINKSSTPVLIMKNTPHGVFILGYDILDLLGPDKLESKWGKKINFGTLGGFVADMDDNYYIVSAKGDLFHVDTKAGICNLITTGLPFRGDVVQNIELQHNEIIITLAQGLVKVSKQGQVIWNKKYPVLEASFGSKMLVFAASSALEFYALRQEIRSDVYSFSGGVTGNSKYDQTAMIYDAKSSIASSAASEAYNLINTRFQAKQDSEKKSLFLTKNPEGQSVSFVVVDKITGEERYIDVDSKNPMFTFDHVDQMLYVVKENKAIEAYQIR